MSPKWCFLQLSRALLSDFVTLFVRVSHKWEARYLGHHVVQTVGKGLNYNVWWNWEKQNTPRNRVNEVVSYSNVLVILFCYSFLFCTKTLDRLPLRKTWTSAISFCLWMNYSFVGSMIVSNYHVENVIIRKHFFFLIETLLPKPLTYYDFFFHPGWKCTLVDLWIVFWKWSLEAILKLELPSRESR